MALGPAQLSLRMATTASRCRGGHVRDPKHVPGYILNEIWVFTLIFINFILYISHITDIYHLSSSTVSVWIVVSYYTPLSRGMFIGSRTWPPLHLV